MCAAEWDVEPPLCRARQVFVHHRNIHASGFRSLAEGEPVEFVMGTEQKTGKVAAPSAHPPRGPCASSPVRAAPPRQTAAFKVTGPDGAFVQGGPPPRTDPRDRGRYDEY